VLSYQIGNPTPDDLAHGLWAYVDANGQLSFTVRAGGDSEALATFGSGRDMFDSLMLRLNNDNVNVSSIQGQWYFNTDGVNAAQYQSAIESGLSPSDAAFSTWTGSQVMRYGFNFVTVPEAQGGIIKPVFQQVQGETNGDH